MSVRPENGPRVDGVTDPITLDILALLSSTIPERCEQGACRLLEAHGDGVFRLLRRRYGQLLGEEDLWESIYMAVVKVCRSVTSFDIARGTLRAWFFRVAERVAIDMLRRYSKQEHLNAPLTYEPADEREQEFESRTALLVELLVQAIAELPPMQRTIIEADLAAGEVADARLLAEQLQTTPNSIYVSRNKARDNIREWFNRQGIDLATFGRSDGQPGGNDESA